VHRSSATPVAGGQCKSDGIASRTCAWSQSRSAPADPTEQFYESQQAIDGNEAGCSRIFDDELDWSLIVRNSACPVVGCHGFIELAKAKCPRAAAKLKEYITISETLPIK
jgi:hypothetical protein